MLFAVLSFAAIMLTYSMFQSRSSMLGFPCLIFWAILGGYCYQQSTTTWDIYYLLFFGSFGMAIFSTFAAYALRTKKEEAKEGDLYFDEGGDKDVKFIDEGGSPSESKEYCDEQGDPRRPTKKADEEVVGDRTRGIRERAAARRSRLNH